MLATITHYWFLTLPTVFTGFILLRKMKQLRKDAETRSLVPATITRKK